jgi:Putative peptidoglycan binding domain
MITMYDSDQNSQFPPGAAAYAAYVDGGLADQPNFQWIVEHFPGAHHVSITLSPSSDADFLDIEPGAATVGSAAGWYARQRARGVARPGFYASVSAMASDLVPAIRAAGITRSSVRLWSAHYGAGEHICGPSTCRWPGITTAVDGTQWTSNALGRNLDQSLLADNFFGTAPPSPVPTWETDMIAALPTLTLGSDDASQPHWFVHRVQAILNAIYHNSLTVDGAYGPATQAAVEQLQQGSGITVDGEVGPQTWGLILTGSPA